MIDRSTGQTHLFNLSAAVLKGDHYRDLFPQIIHGLPAGDIIPLFIIATANADDCKCVYAAASGQPNINLFAC